MNAETHNKIIGILYFVVGGICLICFLAGAVMMGISLSEANSNQVKNNPGSLVLLIVIWLFLFIIPIIFFIAGFGILRAKKWGRIFGIIVGFLLVINIPIGTAIGGYALWFFLSGIGSNFYANGGKSMTYNQQFNNQPPNFNQQVPPNWQ